MPLIVPFTSDRNLTPSSVGCPSAEMLTGVLDELQMVHGQVAGGDADCAGCVMVIVWPATVSDPMRVAVPPFAATL